MTDRPSLHVARALSGLAKPPGGGLSPVGHALLAIATIAVAGTGWSAMAAPRLGNNDNQTLAFNQKIAALEARIASLESRVKKIEDTPDMSDEPQKPTTGAATPANPGPATAAAGGSEGGASTFSLNSIKGPIRRVVAPFEVVNASGHVIFSVTSSGATQGIAIYDKEDHPVAAMSSTAGGGQVEVFQGGDSDSYAALRSNTTAAGMVVEEKGQRRVEVASSTDGGYVWVYGNQSGIVPVAALQGSDSGKGYVYVFNGSGQPIASLSKGENGGVLELTDSGGTLMVQAGTLPDHVGIVRTGPASRAPGGLMGVPGSYITGKGN